MGAQLSGAADPVDGVAGLPRAIAADALTLHFQPIVDLTRGVATGVEALVRWPHPDGVVLAPDEFLPAVEQTPVMTAMTRWVMRAACTEVARWPGWRVAVNISGRDLVGGQLIDAVDDALAVSGLSADCLTLELTETSLVRDLAQAAASLTALRARGVGIALDDFGTGYSSMLYLRDLPVSAIKVDREFIAGIDQPGGDRAIVASMLALARSIGLTAVAEGVETAEQERVLRSLNCPSAQGYWWSRPLPAADVDRIYSEGLPDPLRRPRSTRCQPGDASDPYLVSLLTPLLAEGASLRTMAAALNAAGERTSNGTRWHPASVAQLVSQLG